MTGVEPWRSVSGAVKWPLPDTGPATTTQRVETSSSNCSSLNLWPKSCAKTLSPSRRLELALPPSLSRVDCPTGHPSILPSTGGSSHLRTRRPGAPPASRLSHFMSPCDFPTRQRETRAARDAVVSGASRLDDSPGQCDWPTLRGCRGSRGPASFSTKEGEQPDTSHNARGA